MRDSRSRANLILVAATLLAAGVLLTATLLVPPIVGMADNGDSDRVLNPAGLEHESQRDDERYFQWMQPRFTRVARTPDPSYYRTSESLLVEVAMAADRALSSAPSFDIRFLAAVHMLLLLAALALLVRACRGLPFLTQMVVAILLVFFFTDVGYTAPFNSVYSQTPSLLFLLLTAGVAAAAVQRGRLDGVWLLVYFVCAALFVGSKPQESIQAPLLAMFGVRLAWPGAGRARHAAAILLALALGGFAWRYYQSAQGSVGSTTRYNILFLEILRHSPDPARDLAELGLDPGWVRYTGIPPGGPGRLLPIPPSARISRRGPGIRIPARSTCVIPTGSSRCSRGRPGCRTYCGRPISAISPKSPGRRPWSWRPGRPLGAASGSGSPGSPG